MVGVAGALLIAAPAASAATYTDDCTQLAADLVSGSRVVDNDTVYLNAVCSNTSFTVSNTHKFTLAPAPGASPQPGFDGDGGSAAILTSSVAVNLTISGLLFENAPHGAIAFSASNEAPTIHGDTFTGNGTSTGPSDGGAISLTGAHTKGQPAPTIEGNTFSGNQAAVGGGAVYSAMGAVAVTNNRFTGNTTQFGGGLYVSSGTQDDTLTLTGNTFGGTGSGDGNTAKLSGGGAYISLPGSEQAAIARNQFIDNQLSGSSSVSNDRAGGGLALVTAGGSPPFDASQIDNVFSGNVVATTSTGSSRAGGGGEWDAGVSVTSVGDVFRGNSVTVAGTPAPEGGGLGVLSASGTPAAPASFAGSDDVFQGNTITAAGAWGAGIYTGGPAGACEPPGSSCPSTTLTLDDSTVTGNTVGSAGDGPAIWGYPQDALTVNNSIVFGNSGGIGGPEVVGYGSPGYAFTDLCTTPGSGAPVAGTGNICANPQLNANAEETSASPTIDRGSNDLVPAGLTSDFEGNPRITGGLPADCTNPIVDMGAFESPSASCVTRPFAPRCQVTHTSAFVPGTKKPKHHHHRPAEVKVGFRCNETAAVDLSGVLHELIRKGRSRRLRLRGETLIAPAGANIKTSLAIPKGAVKLLQRGIRETVDLQLAAFNANGSSRVSAELKLKVHGGH